MKHLTMALGLCLFSLGCRAGFHPVSPSLVKSRAVSDLKCTEADVTVTQLNTHNWKAEGCGKEASYTCSEAGWGTEGMCMKEGQ